MGVTLPSEAAVGLELFDLHDRVALITGGSKGLGASIAEGLAAAGADVIITSRHGEEAAKTATTISSRTGSRSLGLESDVGDEAAVDRLMALSLEEFGQLDIVVNSAAVTTRGPIETTSAGELARVWSTNVLGTWLICRAVLPIMRAAGRGRIVNLSSTSGLVGAADRTAYAATKGAVIQITKSLALECAREGVTANVIAPGPFLTAINEPIADTDRMRHVINSEVAMKRWGRLNEIQGAAIYLASDASSFVTGTVLVVDGGMTAR